VRADAAQAWLDGLPGLADGDGAADGDLDRPPERVGACSSVPAPAGLVGVLAALGLALRRRRGGGPADAE
jgi:MYXO-CTERM domain-containing protein